MEKKKNKSFFAKGLLVPILLLGNLLLSAQETPANTESLVEKIAGAEPVETEDDSYLQDLSVFKKHPVNLNTADVNQLREFKLLTDLHIKSLLQYRELLGKIIHIYELQAIPSWDLSLVYSILPYISIADPIDLRKEAHMRFRYGDHQLLFRISRQLEFSKKYKDSLDDPGYAGGPQRIFFRYRYNYKNLLQYGIVGDKDPGEQFFKGKQSAGFDFYSVHFFLRNTGIIRQLAIGDFTVNMGQGLIQWQSLAFKKSAGISSVKRQSVVLRPYNSAGEINFHRGAGITVGVKKFDITVFYSNRRMDANTAASSVSGEEIITSFLSSGYHRTAMENQKKGNIRQQAMGGSVTWNNKKNFQMGVNAIQYRFSNAIEKRNEPYNHFALQGKTLLNTSIDYSYTFKNFHLFGEYAMSSSKGNAMVHGLLLSAGPAVDLVLFYRSIQASYQSINANAFTESSTPSNEKGMYTGLTLRPFTFFRIDMYADLFSFPWLKYLVDAPGRGKEYLIQGTCTPSKQFEIYSRYRTTVKPGNSANNDFIIPSVIDFRSRQWRTQVSFKVTKDLTIRNRVELVWYRSGEIKDEGFLSFFDVIWKPMMKPLSLLGRLCFFETEGYNSRVYAYENDVPYSFSIPSFSGKGSRFYLAAGYEISGRISLSARIASTVYSNPLSVEVAVGEKKSHQAQFSFQSLFSF